jgi:hypothetical protein
VVGRGETVQELELLRAAALYVVGGVTQAEKRQQAGAVALVEVFGRMWWKLVVGEQLQEWRQQSVKLLAEELLAATVHQDGEPWLRLLQLR